jgi:hypothetical protein
MLQASKVMAAAIVLAATLCASQSAAVAQETVTDKIDRLDGAMARVQAQIEQSERELQDLKAEMSQLRQQAKPPGESVPAEASGSSAVKLASAVEEMKEKQEVQESQLAVQDQAKVGSDSKYPVTISGMILMNSFVNTRAVDSASTPAVAYAGSGATGATLRQSVLGIDANGPHLFGARSHADIRADFDGQQAGGSYSNGAGFLRLRTAHADLDWRRTKAFFSYDRPLLSPDSPTSLTAVAVPALAWSGNLWAWNPQAGLSQMLPVGSSTDLQLQAALIDVGDPPSLIAGAVPPVTIQTSEQSRWPGAQGRLSLLDAKSEGGAHLGAGGFFAPHRTASGWGYNSWAASADFHLPVFLHLDIEGNIYRGQALGGLGGGAFKDYVYRMYGGEGYFRTLDDEGGWLQAKQKIRERLEFNEAIGIDNIPAHELRPFAVTDSSSYYNLARNRTFTGNVIYRPSAYLLYSLEYRRIESSSVDAPTAPSDIIGIAAGYRF